MTPRAKLALAVLTLLVKGGIDIAIAIWLILSRKPHV